MSTAERSPVWVKCLDCKHVWAAMYTPMMVTDAARVMKRLCCPMCAATSRRIAPASAPSSPASEDRLSDALRVLARLRSDAVAEGLHGIVRVIDGAGFGASPPPAEPAPVTPFGEAVALIRDAFGDAQAGKVFGTENALCDETVARLRAFLVRWDGPTSQTEAAPR